MEFDWTLLVIVGVFMVLASLLSAFAGHWSGTRH